MTISELIAALQEMQKTLGADADVLAQSHGCCFHGHQIKTVEAGVGRYKGYPTSDEVGCVVIRS
jgi:hypothetical protein